MKIVEERAKAKVKTDEQPKYNSIEKKVVAKRKK